MNDWNRELGQDLGTPELSDALDRLGLAGQCHGLQALNAGSAVVGLAYTVRYGPIGHDGGTVGDYVDDIPDGWIPVLDNQGRTDTTVWGDLLTTVASSRRLGGTIIDGVCRDSARSTSLAYPIFSRGRWMRTGKDRVRVEEVQGAVSIGGVRVRPGDLIVGDDDGVVAIAHEHASRVVEVAREIGAAEAEIRAAIAAGSTLRAAREAVGYHRLQTRGRTSPS